MSMSQSTDITSNDNTKFNKCLDVDSNNSIDESIDQFKSIKNRRNLLDYYYIMSGKKNLFNLNHIKKLNNNERIVDYKTMINEIIIDKLSISFIDLVYDVSNRGWKSIVSVISFDNTGVLVAIAESSGFIRIFDFDEILHQMQSKSVEPVAPVVTFSTLKTVSDIVWSKRNDNLIYLCFNYKSEILAVDLTNLKERTVNTVDSSNLTERQKRLGGFRKLLLLPMKSNLKENEQILAGSSSGYIQLWSFSLKSCQSYCNWDFHCDPNTSNQSVSDLKLLSDPRFIRFVSLSSFGIVCVWDADNLNYPPFSSSGVPTCIRRIKLSQYSNDFICCQVITNYPYHLYLQCGNGSVVKVDLSAPNSNIEVIPTTNIGSSNNMALLGNTSVSFHSNENHLHIVDLNDSLIRPTTCTNVIYQRCLDACLTLPGVIEAAETGNRCVVVSNDLSKYLTTEIKASTECNHSHEILFQWTDKTSGKLMSTSNFVSGIFDKAIYLSKPYIGPTVTSSYPRIILRTNLTIKKSTNSIDDSKPSDPILYKSNNYYPSSITMPYLLQRVCKNFKRIRKSIEMRSEITVTCAHPTLPYVIIGMLCGDIQILSPDIGI